MSEFPGAFSPPEAGPARAALVGVGFVWGGTPVVESSELFAEARHIIIRHEGEAYRLEKTRSGKLILKK